MAKRVNPFIHRSKKDIWLVSLIWLSVLVPLAIGILLLMRTGGDKSPGWTLTTTGVVTGLVTLLLTYPLRYEILPSELKVRCGLMRWRIPLASIQDVRPTKNPASAPAWSLDRVQIDYLKDGETRSLLISPEDKSAFMREIESARPSR
jgi:membrane protein YdbS with pleckstrin-like domain